MRSSEMVNHLTEIKERMATAEDHDTFLRLVKETDTRTRTGASWSGSIYPRCRLELLLLRSCTGAEFDWVSRQDDRCDYMLLFDDLLVLDIYIFWSLL